MFARLLTFSALFLVAVPMAARTEADEAKSNSPFVGTWLSIDPRDGSHQTIIITQHGRLFNMQWRESFWSICNGRPGLMDGTGQVNPEPNGASFLLMQRQVVCLDPREIVIRDTATFELRGSNVLLATAGNGAFQNQELMRISVDSAARDVGVQPNQTVPMPVSYASTPSSRDADGVVLSPQELAFETPRMLELRRTVDHLEEEVARLSRMIATLYPGTYPDAPQP